MVTTNIFFDPEKMTQKPNSKSRYRKYEISLSRDNEEYRITRIRGAHALRFMFGNEGSRHGNHRPARQAGRPTPVVQGHTNPMPPPAPHRHERCPVHRKERVALRGCVLPFESSPRHHGRGRRHRPGILQGARRGVRRRAGPARARPSAAAPVAVPAPAGVGSQTQPERQLPRREEFDRRRGGMRLPADNTRDGEGGGADPGLHGSDKHAREHGQGVELRGGAAPTIVRAGLHHRAAGRHGEGRHPLGGGAGFGGRRAGSAGIRRDPRADRKPVRGLPGPPQHLAVDAHGHERRAGDGGGQLRPAAGRGEIRREVVPGDPNWRAHEGGAERRGRARGVRGIIFGWVRGGDESDRGALDGFFIIATLTK